MKKIRYSTRVMMFVGIMVLIQSCKKDDDELALKRMFRPATITATNGTTESKISWDASLFTMAGEATYVVQVSSDSAGFSQIDFTDTTQDLSVRVTDQIVSVRKNLYARVKALSIGKADESRWENSAAFVLTGEQFFLPLPSSDIIDVSALLHWQMLSTFTRIVVTPLGGGSPVEIPLNTTSSAAGVMQIDNLIPAKSYAVEIFEDKASKGLLTFTMKPSIPGNIVHIESSTDPTILSTTLADASVPSGSVIVLKRGMTYNLTSGYSFSKSLTIMSGYELGVPAQAKINNNSLNVVLGSALDSIVFRDVFIYTPDPTTGKYVFNINTVCTVGQIKLDNCRIENVRSVARVQTASTGAKVTNLVINNCVIDSVRDFGVVAQSSASSFTNITIQNSTFYKAQKFIVNSGTGISNSIIIKNCTFNDLPTGGATAVNNYFIDYNANDIANGITIQNCIFGKTRSDFAATPSTNSCGIRSGANTAVTVTSCYNTNDFLIVTGPIPNLSLYSKPSTSLWVNPSPKFPTDPDFHFKDFTYPATGTTGDPRWRP